MLAWASRQAGETLSVGTTYPQATSATVVRLDGVERSYTLKAFTFAAFVAEDPDRAEHEARMLRIVGDILPVPRSIGVDTDGSEAGVPAILMTWVPGRRPAPPPVSAAARHAAVLHRSGLTLPWTFSRYTPTDVTDGPEWASDPVMWAEAIEASRDLVWEPVPIHRDYHPGNLLWDDDGVTGIVDWPYACEGPAGIDVARFRLDLFLDGDTDSGDRFLGVYESAAPEYHHDPRWDLADAIDVLPFYDGEDAVTSWGDDARRIRLEAFIRRALDAC